MQRARTDRPAAIAARLGLNTMRNPARHSAGMSQKHKHHRGRCGGAGRLLVARLRTVSTQRQHLHPARTTAITWQTMQHMAHATHCCVCRCWAFEVEMVGE